MRLHAKRFGGWRFVITLLTALACTASVQAESGAYRIEILVFRYTGDLQEPRSADVIRRFPQAWPLFDERPVVYPDDPAPLGVVSEQMKSIWRRLENAAGIEPLYQQTWEQSRIDYHPPVRIHDDRVMHEQFHLPSLADIDLLTPDFLSTYRERYYRLDGSAQLRRSRFLHLEFDLEFRTELLPPRKPDTELEQSTPGTDSLKDHAAPSVLLAQDDAGSGSRRRVQLKPAPYWNPPLPEAVTAIRNDAPPGARYFRLRESRQVRTGELMYFDTPYLGVIARVTATAGE